MLAFRWKLALAAEDVAQRVFELRVAEVVASARSAKAGARTSDGRSMTRPSVAANSLFETGCGAVRLTGPHTVSVISA